MRKLIKKVSLEQLHVFYHNHGLGVVLWKNLDSRDHLGAQWLERLAQ